MSAESKNRSLEQSLEGLHRAMIAREEREGNQPKPTATAKIIQFPLPFGEDTRAVSNPFARCSLFAAVNERQHFKDWVLIGEINGVVIEFKGEQFNQDEHDTLIQLVKSALHKELGQDIEIPVNAILRGLGRSTHKSQRQQFFKEIDRLVSGSIRFTPKGKPSYHGHIVEDTTTPQDQAVLPAYRRGLKYRLNAKFAGFYDPANYTLIDRAERQKLGRSPLLRWLHLWIVGNAEQYPHKVETIRQKCGSKTKELYAFRQALRRSLDELKTVGIITGWKIDGDDLVHIGRTPSSSQQKHITKKASKKPKK
jgi:hypothetical protein